MKAFLAALVVATLALLVLFPPGAAAEAPKEGDPVPDLSLALDDGTKLALRGLGRPAVVYFYPKDDTPGCTKAACTVRDRSADLEKSGALVVGVSFDSAESHKAFREKYKLKFALATDDGKLAEAFGVKVYGIAPLRFHARDTFVFSKDGKIAAILRGVDPVEHVDQVLAAIKG